MGGPCGAVSCHSYMQGTMMSSGHTEAALSNAALTIPIGQVRL